MLKFVNFKFNNITNNAKITLIKINTITKKRRHQNRNLSIEMINFMKKNFQTIKTKQKKRLIFSNLKFHRIEIKSI